MCRLNKMFMDLNLTHRLPSYILTLVTNKLARLKAAQEVLANVPKITSTQMFTVVLTVNSIKV